MKNIVSNSSTNFVAKYKKAKSGNKHLAKMGRHWKTEAQKHLAHISLLKKKLKDSKQHATGKLNIIVNTS